MKLEVGVVGDLVPGQQLLLGHAERQIRCSFEPIGARCDVVLDTAEARSIGIEVGAKFDELSRHPEKWDELQHFLLRPQRLLTAIAGRFTAVRTVHVHVRVPQATAVRIGVAG